MRHHLTHHRAHLELSTKSGQGLTLSFHNHCRITINATNANGATAKNVFSFIELAPVRNAFLVEPADRDDKLLAQVRDYFIAVNTYKQRRQNVGVFFKTESKLVITFHHFEDIQSLMISV